MNTDDKIRAILKMEADAVDPSPAGWDAITTGVAARRRRTWWVRGGALATAALTVAAVAFVVTGDTSRDSIDQTPTSPGPSSVVTTDAPTPSASASASATAAPVVDEPTGAIWPLTTTREVAAWEADRATYPSLASVSDSALAFARNYLGIPDAAVSSVDARNGSLFFEVRRGQVVVSTLELRGYGADGGAPYLVHRATSDAMDIDTPTIEARVTDPLVASGTYRAADPAFTVTLRADGAGSAPVDLVSRRANTGPPNVWDALLVFTTEARTGSVLITDSGGEDGGVVAAAAVPVTFAETTPSVTPSPPAAAAPVGTYVGVRDQRVAVFTVGSSSPVRYLTEQMPGGGPGSPDLSPDRSRVVWVQGGGTCATSLLLAPVGGGEPVALKTPASGIVTKVAWVGNDAVAYSWYDCETDATTIRLHRIANAADQEIGTTTEPRAVAASPDGKFVAWATETKVVSYEVASRKASTMAGREGCTFVALDVPEVTRLGFPILLTGHYCGPDPQVLVEQGTPHAPGRDTMAEVERDATVWRISRDSTGRLIVSHGVEDAPPYVEFFDREGKRSETRNVNDASW